MRDFVILFVHLIATVARIAGSGGVRSVVAESVLVKQQLLILNRSRKRAPNLRASDRIIAGLCALLMRPARIIRSAIVLKPSHPFVERLIGTIRREGLDQMLFWTTTDLENKLLDFRTYFNSHRTHASIEGRTPDPPVSEQISNIRSYRWRQHCRGLYQTPTAA